MPLLATAGVIINDVVEEVGLAAVASPYGSADPNFVQMRALLRSTGDELVLLYGWESLIKEGTFTTDGGSSYPLPVDFERMIDQTQWNRTEDTPVGGPLNAQEWRYNLESGLGPVLRISFRIQQGTITIQPESDTGNDIYYEYISKYWGGASGVYPEDDDDQVQIPAVVVKRYLKVKWQEAKGFNSTRSRADLDLFFNSITGKNKGARVLSLTRRKMFPFLSEDNVPDIGYGS